MKTKGVQLLGSLSFLSLIARFTLSLSLSSSIARAAFFHRKDDAMLLLIFRFKKRGGGGSSCLKGAKWWWWKSKKGKTFLFFFWGGEGKAWDAFYLLVIHATDTALLAPPSEEGCLEAPGRNSAKSAVVVRRSLLKRGRGGEQKAWSEKKLEEEELNCSRLTWVKHDVQVQRARRAARNVLPRGELLLFFFG